MKYRRLLFLFATIFLVAAAPVQDTVNQDALLQEALDDTKSQEYAVAAVDDSSAAAESKGGEELTLDILEKVLDFVKRKYNQSMTSNPSKQQSVFRTADFVQASVPVSRRIKWFTRKPQIPRRDLIGAIPRASPQPQPTNFPETPDLPRALPRCPNSGNTDDPHPSCRQTFLPRVNQDLSSANHKPQETGDGSEEAEIEAFAAILGTALKAFKALKFLKNLAPSSGSRSDSSSRTNIGDRGTSTSPSGWGNLARRFLGFPGDKENDGSNSPAYGPQVEIEGINQDIEDEEETAEEQVTQRAEIEKFKIFKAFLGKALKVLKHKLRPRSRTLEEDGQAVNNPTKWKDLGRNLLGTIGDRLDPSNVNPGTEEETAEEQVSEEAEIERLRSFLSRAIKVLQRRLESHSRKPGEDKEAAKNSTKWTDLGQNLLQLIRDRLDQTDGRNERRDEGFEVEIEGAHLDGDDGDENAAAEIEGFRSFLKTALERLDSKLKPSSRSPEEDTREVRDPKKWTDLGRNFIRVLKDKLDKERSGPGRENKVEIEGAVSDHIFDDETEEERAEKESWLKIIPKVIKVYKTYKDVRNTFKNG